MTVAVDLRTLNSYPVTALNFPEVYVGPVCKLYGQHAFFCNGDSFYPNTVRAVLSVRSVVAFIAFVSFFAFYFSEIYRGIVGKAEYKLIV